MQSIGAASRGASFVLGSESQLAVTPSASESVEHLTAKESAEDAHWEQEFAGRGHPTTAIVSKAASGNDAVHVRVEDKLTCPGVKHCGDAKLCRSAEPFRIATQLEQRIGGGFHEQLEDGGSVAQGK
jgi:hypothetical protein